jgi:hypothetical protein
VILKRKFFAGYVNAEFPRDLHKLRLNPLVSCSIYDTLAKKFGELAVFNYIIIEDRCQGTAGGTNDIWR